MKQSILLSILLSLFLSSCQVEEYYHFNKDYSGSNQTTVHIGKYVNTVLKSDRDRKKFVDNIDAKLKEGISKIEALDGISNGKGSLNEDSTEIKISYDFAGISELNQSLDALNKLNDNKNDKAQAGIEKSKKPYGIFIKKSKKKLIYRFVKPKDEKKGSQFQGSFDQLFKTTMVFSFERKVKSVNFPEAKILADENKVIIDQQAFTKSQTDVVFKLK